ncbi:tape measure protein [Aurantimonas endophytica]|uniref:Tape measure domain-containing protein n=1 Tax=Aurantimonas endophytica TaxID=1522175 RepID=A0A7W6HCI2_9HYPH|nr:tape measure protein [Aurantimonas endophytica]MBB4002646.1 tape measure domain-containing protein [Aurantimonas endophytica]MCO6403526.1 tape measure protein [Aurantimonas endophytica]
MARDVEDLVLSISADTAQIRRALKRLEGDTKKTTSIMERNFATMNTRVGASAVAMSRTLAAAFAGAVTLRGAQQLVDSSIRIQNALKTTGLEGEALKSVYDQLFAAAQKNAAPIESLVTLYSKLAINQKELNVSSDELVSFSETIAVALRAGGTSAAEASGALLQLSQAMGGGVVRAEEFTSILEGAPTILQAAAAGIKEAGGSVATLRQLMLDGELSSQAFFRGIEAGSGILEDRLATAGTTVSQAFVRLQNVLQDTAGRLNTGTEASEKISGALNSLSDTIAGMDFSSIISGLDNVGDAASRVVGGIINVSRALGEMAGLPDWLERHNAMMDNLRSMTPPGGGDARISGAFEVTEGTGISGASVAGGRGGRLPRVNPQITLDKYPVAGDGKTKKPKKTDEERSREKAIKDADREAEAVRELIADLEHEQLQIGMTNEQRQISDALRRVNVDAMSAEGQAIAGLITAIEQEEAAMEKLAQTQEEVNDVARDVFSGMITDLQEGTSAADMLANALSKVADYLTNMALDSLFAGLPGGGGATAGGRAILGTIHTLKLRSAL